MVKNFIKERIGSIILLVIVLVMVAWGWISIRNAKNNAVTSAEAYEEPEGNVDFEAAGSYESVAKNDVVELFYNEAKGAIQIKDLRNGYLWKGIVDDEIYDMESVNKRWTAYLTSSISVSYSNLEKRDTVYSPMYSARDANILETEYLEDGVSVTYGFGSIGIYVTVEYTIDDEGLVVRVPMDKVREDTVYLLNTIEVLPFLGASGDEVDGYMVYPDGSGAVTLFSNVNERPSGVKASMYRIYSDKNMDYFSLYNEDNRERYTASLPVIGMKRDDKAFLGVITEGAESAGMGVYPSGSSNIRLNHIGFELYTRNLFNVGVSSVSGEGGIVTNTATVQRVDKNLIMQDREIHYFFLEEDLASYSGMARRYRDYLLETEQIHDVIPEGAQMPLALEILMGITKDGMVFDEYVTMTDFDDVVSILKKLKAKGVNATETVLTDWIKGGQNTMPDYWPPARQLGGTSGMKDLNEYAQVNPDDHIYLQNQFTIGTTDGGGFSEVDDVAYDGLEITVSMEDFDGVEYYMLNPQTSFDRNARFLEKMEKYDSLGVGYDYLGYITYPDYNKQHPFTRTEMVNKLKEMLRSTKDAAHTVAVSGENQYAYEEANYLYRTREGSYGLSISDYSIPFVQMVLSGLVPYSTENAGNLTYDLQTQKMKWIEYGALPYFHLTQEPALNFRESDFDDIFSSTYDEWEDRVVEVYQDMYQNLQEVYGQPLIDHEVLEDNLVRVEYENGTVIYINYNGSERTAEGTTVPANSYVVVKGGE